MHRHGHVTGVTLALLVLVAVIAVEKGFSGAAGAEVTPTISPAAAKEAADIFNTRCALCHGMSGKGDGTAAAGLDPKPRNYGDVAWQSSVTDEQIEKIILGGGAAVGKSALMPANPDLESKPEVVKALRATIRRFGSKGAAPTK